MKNASDRLRLQGGISKLEFAVVAVIFGVLAAILLGRLSEVEVGAEATEVEITISNIRSGMRMAINDRMMKGKGDRLEELLSSNPVTFLITPPRGYVELAADTGVRGAWYYDQRIRVLTYRPRQPQAFGGKTELHWRISQHGNGNNESVAGIQLEEMP
ncbi:MAG: hypothetical protein HZA62_02470 [Rhodocyclales bacterium]|nr:hypothetical protein [Rhodocyclales bacterium]